MHDWYSKNKQETIIIGGGQAGLSVGYYLKKSGIPFQILDANPRVGDAWRNRWDSLRLFTTARYCGLPGMPFPARPTAFPTKDEMADYLESYAERFQLPIETGIKVDSLTKVGDDFVITAGARTFVAKQVVVAMSSYQRPATPTFARDLAPKINQLHSCNYRNPSQLRAGGVLIVGAGNSGADIAIEVARSHQTFMSGTESGVVPFHIETFFGRHIVSHIIRFVFHYIISLGTPIGRKRYPKLLHGHAPLVRVKPNDLKQAGVERVARAVGVRDGFPLLEDGRLLDGVSNVIWCTGFRTAFSWVDLPIFNDDGLPRHDQGIVSTVPGLYFVGLHFLYSFSSATLMGIGRDAKFIASAVKTRFRPTPASTRVAYRQSETMNA